jgi:type IV pilus assembly protein PilE
LEKLQDISLRQERWRSNNATYATCDQAMAPGTCANLNNPAVGGTRFYTIAVSNNTATGYAVTATPKNAQVGDRCGTYTYTMASGTLGKAVSGDADCRP